MTPATARGVDCGRNSAPHRPPRSLPWTGRIWYVQYICWMPSVLIKAFHSVSCSPSCHPERELTQRKGCAGGWGAGRTGNHWGAGRRGWKGTRGAASRRAREQGQQSARTTARAALAGSAVYAPVTPSPEVGALLSRQNPRRTATQMRPLRCFSAGAPSAWSEESVGMKTGCKEGMSPPDRFALCLNEAESWPVPVSRLQCYSSSGARYPISSSSLLSRVLFQFLISIKCK